MSIKKGCCIQVFCWFGVHSYGSFNYKCFLKNIEFFALRSACWGDCFWHFLGEDRKIWNKISHQTPRFLKLFAQHARNGKIMFVLIEKTYFWVYFSKKKNLFVSFRPERSNLSDQVKQSERKNFRPFWAQHNLPNPVRTTLINTLNIFSIFSNWKIIWNNLSVSLDFQSFKVTKVKVRFFSSSCCCSLKWQELWKNRQIMFKKIL